MARFLNLLPWRRRRLERDLDRELQYHVDRRIDDLRRTGVSDEEARRRVAVEFGGVLQVREEVRETWVWRWLDDRQRDVRYALRMLRRSPAVTATAMLSLAIGIGGNAAIVSLVDQVLLRKLPVREPDRLVQLEWNGRMLAATYGFGSLLSYPLCRDLQDLTQVFDGVFCCPAGATSENGRLCRLMRTIVERPSFSWIALTSRSIGSSMSTVVRMMSDDTNLDI